MDVSGVDVSENQTTSSVTEGKSQLPQRVFSTPKARFAFIQKSETVAPSAASGAPKTKVGVQEQTHKKKRVDPLQDKYRDRAEERRQRAEPAPIENEEILDADALRERRELSKYLGGSEETTHLVEGVDIMLYERRKLEIELEAQRRKQEEALEAQGSILYGAKQLVIDQFGHAKAVDVPQEFVTAIGRGIYNTLFQRERPPQIETFLPGRTTYVFSLDRDSTQELPMIIERSMLSDTSDTAERDIRYESISTATGSDAFNRLSVVMSYVNQGDKGIKKRRQELQEKEARAKAVVKETLMKVVGSSTASSSSKAHPASTEIDEDDEDIFGDVASKEYVPTETKTSANTDSKSSRPPTTEELWKAVRAEDQDGRALGDVSAKRSRDSMTTARSDNAMDEDDGYGFESGSDDEENIFSMDTGVRLKRADFTSDAEWEKYAATREAIPKSAFSFGVKASDRQRKERRGKSEKTKIYQAMYKSVSGSIGAKDKTER
jgi:hypothetical protein